MGKGSTNTERETAAQGSALNEISVDLYNRTTPVTQAAIDNANALYSGEFDPMTSPMWSPGKRAIESQYGSARENVLSTLPQGGQLNEGLVGLEASRASGLSDMVNNIMMDEYNKAYGIGTEAPQTTISGMGTAGQIGVGVVQGQAQRAGGEAGGMGSACCFIFIAAHGGVLHPIVRRYRENHMTTRNRRGYYWIADRLVPLMKKHKAINFIVKKCMVEPMTSYGKYFYNINKIGVIFAPITSLWLRVFDLVGSIKPYRRMGSKEVV